MKATGLVETQVAGALTLALTLVAFVFFFLSHRARAILWFDSAPSSLQVGEDDVRKKGAVSGGLYLLETIALAAACYLLVVSFRVLGVAGTGLWSVSPVASLFAVLVLAPFFLRKRGRSDRAGGTTQRGRGGEGTARQGGRPPFFRSAVLVLATRVVEAFTRSPRRTEETGRRLLAVESGRAKEVLRLLLRLRERKISEVMVLRVDMVCADESSTVLEVADLVREAAYTRIPVFSGTIDSVTGYVTAKDVVIRLRQGGDADAVSSIARKPVYVPSDATIEHVLEEMQKAHVTLAIVTESSVKTAGLVTGEDILEEVVGDLYEDYEPEEPAYQVIDDETAVVRANVALGDLKEIFGVTPRADLAQTLGDYVRKQLGAEAFTGEQVSDEVFFYTVAKTIGKTIWSLKVEKRN